MNMNTENCMKNIYKVFIKQNFYYINTVFVFPIVVSDYTTIITITRNILFTSVLLLHTGVLMGIVVLRNFEVLKWEKKLWWVALIVYIALVIIAIFWNIFYPHYPATDWKKCCPEKLTY